MQIEFKSGVATITEIYKENYKKSLPLTRVTSGFLGLIAKNGIYHNILM